MSIAFKDASELSSEEWRTLEQLVRDFEDAWQRGLQPSVEDYLPAGEPLRRAVLDELVLTDLEYRLREGEQARVEQCLDRFEGLRSVPGVELKLITAELGLRWRREPGLALDEFLARFPQYDAELRSIWRGMNDSGTTVLLRPICPQCREPLDIPADPSPGAVVCRSCGAKITPDPGDSAQNTTPRARLAKYELFEEIGRGAYGIVYRARDTELDRIVAVKILQAAHHASPGAVNRFLREARNAAQLDHPHIVTIHDFGREGETCYLVCAYVPGTTLAQHTAAGRLPFREAAALVARVAEALDYAHLHGVIHRDVKPANILLDQVGEPHLTDFGLARRDAGEITITAEGDMLGTLAYMSPEQARGEAHRVDGRSDLYSLGVILYELLTGQVPFRGTREMVLKQLLEEEPQPPRRTSDRIPRDLETICLKCLEKEPSRRYASAAAMAQDLGRFSRGEPILARPIGRVERVGRWCRRRPAVATLALALALVVIGAIAVYFGQHEHARASDERARLSEIENEKLLNEDVLALGNKLNIATDEHHPLSFLPEHSRNDVLDDILRLRKRLEGSSPNTLRPALRLKAHYVLGWGYSLTAQSAKGKAALADAIKLGEGLRLNNSKDQELAGRLASCYNLRARVLHNERSWAEADSHYEREVRLREDVVKLEPSSSAARANLGLTLVDRANNFRDQGSDRQARELYSTALGIFEEPNAHYPDDSRYLRGEAATLINLAELDIPQYWPAHPSNEEREKAELSRKRLVAATLLYERLHPDPDSMPRIASEHASCYMSLSIVERRLRNFTAATRAAGVAVHGFESIVTYHSGVAECLEAAANADANLGIIYRQAGRLPQASSAFKDALNQIDHAIRLAPGNENYEITRRHIQEDKSIIDKKIREADSRAREAGP